MLAWGNFPKWPSENGGRKLSSNSRISKKSLKLLDWGLSCGREHNSVFIVVAKLNVFPWARKSLKRYSTTTSSHLSGSEKRNGSYVIVSAIIVVVVVNARRCFSAAFLFFGRDKLAHLGTSFQKGTRIVQLQFRLRYIWLKIDSMARLPKILSRKYCRDHAEKRFLTKVYVLSKAVDVRAAKEKYRFLYAFCPECNDGMTFGRFKTSFFHEKKEARLVSTRIVHHCRRPYWIDKGRGCCSYGS